MTRQRYQQRWARLVRFGEALVLSCVERTAVFANGLWCQFHGQTDRRNVRLAVETLEPRWLLSGNPPSGDPPVATPDTLTVFSNIAKSVSVPAEGLLANDYDPDDDPITVVDYSQPANGEVTVNSDGTFTYTPSPGYDGEDGFAYTITDGANFAIATVNVAVVPPIWEWYGPEQATGLWSNWTNWYLLDPTTNQVSPAPQNAYPGAQGFADVPVRFSEADTGAAVLDVSVDSLHSLEFKDWGKTLYLNHNLTISGGDFRLADNSTIDLASNVSLSLVEMGPNNEWSHGNIIAASEVRGTGFYVTGNSLPISGLNGQLGTNLVVGSHTPQGQAPIPGMVTIALTSQNLSLTGAANYIDVQDGGTLRLNQPIAVANRQNLEGGIALGVGRTSPLAVKVRTGGELVRDGVAVPGIANEVMISGVVYNEGGVVRVAQPLTLPAQDANGYGYWQDTADTARLEVYANLFVIGTVQIDCGAVHFGGEVSGYHLEAAALVFGDDFATELKVFGGSGDSVINISGSVTLGQQTTTIMNFSSANNTADLLQIVDGALTLNGTLTLNDVETTPQKPTAALTLFSHTALFPAILWNFTSFTGNIDPAPTYTNEVDATNQAIFYYKVTIS